MTSERSAHILLLLAVAIWLWPGTALSQVADPVPGPIPISAHTVTVALEVQLPDTGPVSRPTARPMTLIGDGTGRRFVADQHGFVHQLGAGGSVSTFLDVAANTNLVSSGGQQGLQSIAFHPDYHMVGAAGEGKFYTSSSQTIASGTPDYPVPSGAPETHHSVIHEWDVDPSDPNAIDPTSAREVLRIGQPYNDHNLAQISFDPTIGSTHPDYGLLYVASGDGGNVCCPRPTVDPHFVGQDLSHPLGAMLRIDPLEDPGVAAYSIPSQNPFASDGDPTTLGEIWAYGLRNPHRFSWDLAGAERMYISDIGQANVEEINVGAQGANYGWSEREGTYLVVHTNEGDVFALPPDDSLLGFTYPVLQYDHDEGDRAITGGYVVRWPGENLDGEYVFGDLRSGRLFHATASDLDGSGQVAFEALRLIDASDDQEKTLLEMIGGGTPAPRADLRFGRDDTGVIYLLTKRDGAVRRLVFAPPSVSTGGALLPLGLALAIAVAARNSLVRHSGRS